MMEVPVLLVYDDKMIIHVCLYFIIKYHNYRYLQREWHILRDQHVRVSGQNECTNGYTHFFNKRVRILVQFVAMENRNPNIRSAKC